MKRVAGVLGLSLACLGVACSSGASKGDSSGPDFGVETSQADSASRPTSLVDLGPGQYGTAVITSSVQWRGFRFAGHAGESVSVYADGLQGFDSVLYLYKVSRTTGRPYGRPVASNDDTADASWTTNALSSSIASFTLPESRNYAFVVTSYGQASSGNAHAWYYVDAPSSQGAMPFPGTGSSSPQDFQGIAVRSLPVSQDVLTTAASAHTANFIVAPVRLKADPASLQAVLADSARLATFTYDLLYNAKAIFNGNNPHLTAQATAIVASSAPSTMATAVGRTWGTEQGRLDDADNAILASMFADGGFATSAVQVYKIHWDNSDDTSAEGILAVDPSSGEVRALTFVVPP